MGRPVESLRVDRRAGNSGLWRDRVCRRLSKVVHRRNLGLTARAKLFYQFLAAIVIGAVLSGWKRTALYSTRLIVPFLKHFRPDLVVSRWHHGWTVAAGVSAFVVFVALIIVGSSNAVNLTDGLDGLAIGCTVIAAGALTVLTYVSGHAVFADYLELSKYASGRQR